MKKLLVILMFICGAGPAFAQWRTLSGWSAWNGLRKSAASAPRVAENVEWGVTRALAKTVPPMATHIQITNLPGEPLVKLGTPLPVPEGMTVRRRFPVLPARMLSGEESAKSIAENNVYGYSAVYIPSVLNTEEPSFYKGIHLFDLKSVKNILRYGLETEKVSTKFHGKMYFSGRLLRTIQFSTDYASEHNLLPTIVRFNVPRGVYFQREQRAGFMDYVIFSDVPANNLMDVMVFLEVGGQPGWYKATLENGKLVFTPAQSRVFDVSEIIEHDILKIPEKNVEEIWGF